MLTSCLLINTSIQEFRAATEAFTHGIEKIQGLEEKLNAMTYDLQMATHELETYKSNSEPQDKIEVSEKITQSSEEENEPGANSLLAWFTHRKKGPGTERWSRYFDAYHRHFNRFRTQAKITIVEVGVQSGGSIEMWQAYFGADKLK